MDTSAPRSLDYPRTVEDIPADELAHIRENIAWFQRFTPLQRLRIAAKQARMARRLQRMRQIEEARDGS